MILEVAILDVKPSLGTEFESAFAQAESIISGMPGYISHELKRCIENPGRYLLLVNWACLEDHTVGFRESPAYAQWRSMVVGYFAQTPIVEHFTVTNP